MIAKRFFLCLSIIFIISGCAQLIRPKKQLREKKFIYVEQEGFHRGLWVRAVSIASPDSIPRILKLARRLGITDIYVQVIVAGYTYYKSNLLPRSQHLSKVSGTEYDPLDSLIKTANNQSIRIHAWVNALLIWSLKEPPDSANHILYTHPEWFIRDVNRRSMANYSYEECIDSGLEGLYLDPANPEVKEHLSNVCVEIVNRYPVVGIHLDFIRYPGTLWGLPNNDTTAIFAGFEGYKLRWLNLIRYPQLSFLLRWMSWHYWKLNKQKERMISQIVKDVSKKIRINAIDPECVLTTSVFPNPSLARWRFAQDWLNWGQFVNYPVVMSYTDDIIFFSDLLNFTFMHKPEAVFGIGFLWPDMEAEAYWEIKAVKQKQGAGICFFDYTNIDTMVDFEKYREEVVINKDSLMNDTIRYAKVTSVFTDLPKSNFVRKGEDLLTPGEDLGFSDFLLSLSLNTDQDFIRMDLSRKEFIKKVQNDIAAFKYLDSVLFPLADKLIEPPRMEVYYEFIPWGEEDSAAVIEKVGKIKELTQYTIVYPNAMDNLARAAFKTEKNKMEMCMTNTGIYVFEVKKIYEGGKQLKRDGIKPELLPLYLSWTIREKIRVLLD